MMKRIAAALLAMTLTLCAPLAVCEPLPYSVSPEQERLDFFLEGEQETVAASRWTFGGASFLIPAEDWELLPPQGNDALSFSPVWNEEVRFTVRLIPAGEALPADYDALAWTELPDDPDDPLSRAFLQQGAALDEPAALVFLSREADGVRFALELVFPAEAAEGYGARMRAMAATFTLPGEES